eukprot:TRINITY_DN2413_c0_g9_i1.p1 TRINITY_DN2413_c0_g9~~TRINITY_DN2413_c0_g9_i1.p1  ORF type:complete len:184 (-),score=16.67 TRINITY_DN2413_c0_g9_i1:188-739(-)
MKCDEKLPDDYVSKKRSHSSSSGFALRSIIASNRRTNARLDKTQFERAAEELKRVGGVGDVLGAYEQAAKREADVVSAQKSAAEHEHAKHKRSNNEQRAATRTASQRVLKSDSDGAQSARPQLSELQRSGGACARSSRDTCHINSAGGDECDGLQYIRRVREEARSMPSVISASHVDASKTRV